MAEVGEGGGAVGSYRGLQKVDGEMEGWEGRKLSRAAREWYVCVGFYGVE